MKGLTQTVGALGLGFVMATTAATSVQAGGHNGIMPTLAKVEQVMDRLNASQDGDLMEIKALMSLCVAQGDDKSEAHLHLARTLRGKVVALIGRLQAAGVTGLDTQVAELMAATTPELG